MNPIILETMNDIINQVETREWKRVNDHRDRLLKKMKNQSQKIENMQDDWYFATHKIAEENSELHKVIKSLIDENKKLKKEKLDENEELMAVIEKMDMRIKDLRNIENDITLHPDYDKLIELEEAH